MKKTIRTIDLLNLIANKGEVPKKINYDGLIYIFDIAENNYISEKADYYDGDYITHKYLTESFEFDILNDEVEILDEEEFEDIEEKNVYMDFSCDYWKQAQIDELANTLTRYELAIKKIIRNQKKIIEKFNKNNNT